MNKTLTWVIGKGGLLGSRLAKTIADRLMYVDVWENSDGKFAWRDCTVLPDQIRRAVAAFAREVRERNKKWMVLWAAGAGVVGTPSEVLEEELVTWRLLLELLGEHLLNSDRPVPGTIFHASSAGGVYGNGADEPLTEASPCYPVSDYGRCKLLQEEALCDWARQYDEIGYLIGRISNIYGPGQKLNKAQGLISHLSRCVIYRHPAHIYVSLDTTRDYIFVDDCAQQIVQCLDRLVNSMEHRRVLKLIVSGQGTSLAQIVGVVSRLARRHVRIICSPRTLRLQQPKRLQFRSIVWPDIRSLTPTDLSVGINRVHQHQMSLFGRGKLAQPALS
jgi:UDP-glucose 4-epimerase